MTCREAKELMAGMLMAERPDPALAAHLETCRECREDSETLGSLWHRLGDLPVPEPGYGLDGRWKSTLEGLMDEAGRGQKRWFIPWPRRPLWQGAIAFASLVIGLAAGLAVNHHGQPPVETGEVARLRGEVAGMREMVALSLLREDSASERLRGVDYGGRVAAADPEVAAALVEAVRHDPSVNVRLAAIDALGRTAGGAASLDITGSMARALPNEESPMVQAALVDYLVDSRDRRARPTIAALAARPGLNPAVQERTRFALEQLSH